MIIIILLSFQSIKCNQLSYWFWLLTHNVHLQVSTHTVTGKVHIPYVSSRQKVSKVDIGHALHEPWLEPSGHLAHGTELSRVKVRWVIIVGVLTQLLGDRSSLWEKNKPYYIQEMLRMLLWAVFMCIQCLYFIDCQYAYVQILELRLLVSLLFD